MLFFGSKALFIRFLALEDILTATILVYFELDCLCLLQMYSLVRNKIEDSVWGKKSMYNFLVNCICQYSSLGTLKSASQSIIFKSLQNAPATKLKCLFYLAWAAMSSEADLLYWVMDKLSSWVNMSLGSRQKQQLNALIWYPSFLPSILPSLLFKTLFSL